MITLSEPELLAARTAAYDRAFGEWRSRGSSPTINLDTILKNAKKIEDYLVSGKIPE